ncbi:MAG: hypothetical protein AAFQ02_07655 [Bacteroidota bacterium]
MKNLIMFGLMFTSIAMMGQEMETTINGGSIDLTMIPDSTGGGTQLNLERVGSNENALINFQYFEKPFTNPFNGGLAYWDLGVKFEPEDEGDFTLSNFRLSGDLAFIRTDLVIREDNGWMGLNIFPTDRPAARLHILHSSASNAEAGFLLGETTNSVLSYMTVNKPTLDASAGIARFRDNGNTQVLIDKSDANFQLRVFGLARAEAWLGDPIVLLATEGTTKSNKLSSTDLLHQLKVDTKSNTLKSDQSNISIDLHSLEQLIPDAVVRAEVSTAISGENNITETTGVDYTKLIPLLVSSLQEESDRNDKLESRILELEKAILER